MASCHGMKLSVSSLSRVPLMGKKLCWRATFSVVPKMRGGHPQTKKIIKNENHRFVFRLFLLRDSQSNPKTFVLSLCHMQKVKHFQILPVSTVDCLWWCSFRSYSRVTSRLLAYVCRHAHDTHAVSGMLIYECFHILEDILKSNPNRVQFGFYFFIIIYDLFWLLFVSEFDEQAFGMPQKNHCSN